MPACRPNSKFISTTERQRAAFQICPGSHIKPLALAVHGALLCLGLAVLPMPNNAFAQSVPPEANDETTLPTVTVVEKLGTNQYYQSDVDAATRTGTPAREVPQSVRVLPRQTLEDIGAIRLDDSLDYVSGISRQNNFGGTWDNLSIRGFAGHEDTGMSLLRNGFSSNRGFNAPRDTANVESIEFLKGPSAALYGNSEPGGTINLVTKKPQFKARHTLDASVGSNDLRRLALDTTGPLGSSVAYRLNVAAEDKGSFRDFVDSKRLLVAPALTWLLSDNTILSYDGELLRQRAPLDRGVAAVNGNLNVMPRSRFIGDPSDGDIEVENQTHQITLEHSFSEQWRTRLGVAYKNGTLEGYGSEVKPFVDVTNDPVKLRRRYRDFESDDLTLQADIQGQIKLGDIQHTVLLGLETYRYTIDTVLNQTNDSMVINNIAGDPVYDMQPPQGEPGTVKNTLERQRNAALFLQDELSLSAQWKLLAGLRYDRYEKKVTDRNPSTPPSGANIEQNNSAVSPRLGLTYLFNPQWSWYASAGKSFRPNSGTDVNYKPFEPEFGRALETGVKFESADRRLGGTLSIFQINKRNVLTGSDADGVFSTTAGEVRSRGLELDIAGQLTPNLRINGSYAHIDTEVTHDNGGAMDWSSTPPAPVNLVGKRLMNVPKNSASVLAVWEEALQGAGAYGLGGGLAYVGQRTGNVINSFSLPSYTTAKLLAYWRVNKQFRLMLNVDNLFDRHYFASSYDRSWIMPGAERAVTLTAQIKF